MEEMRLQKYLAMCNVASRRASEKLITDGRVSVNNTVVTELGTKVSDEDTICVDGKKVAMESKKIYIALNKPSGYVTTVKDEFGRPTVMELTRDIKERIYPVGRLDFNTQGLLLLTNDGDFSLSVTHPSKKLNKVYEATVLGIMDHIDEQKLEKGVYIDGKKTFPSEVEILSHKTNSTIIKITIHEGRNRQVKKMCEAVGHKVLSLKRISIGDIFVGNLPLGKWRHLTSTEIKSLMEGNK